MNNIIFSANIVLPLLILMGLGYLVRRVGMLDAKNVSIFNNIAFKVFLPLLLFNNVRNSDLTNLNNGKLFLFVTLFILFSFIIVTIIILRIEKDNAKRGVMIQGICRSNYALFGIQLVSMLYPGEDIAIASLLIAFTIPLYNVGSVAALTYFGSKKANIRSILRSITTNPLIIATFFGFIFMLLQVNLPIFVSTAIDDIASIATPLSLFLLGASFEFCEVRAVSKQIFITVCGKLIILPIFMLTIAIALGFSQIDLACMMVISGAPTAVSSFTMAEKMGGNTALASSIVIFTSLLSVFTVFIMITLLRSSGLI